jgi:protein O-GlcNAc transferase
VLWLFDAYPGVKANLIKEAEKRGIDPARLVFAPRTHTPEHLARQKLADLFLDNVPINAHTTATEALWVGLPVLTIRGSTFAGRVAPSLLNAMGLPELIAESPADYEQRALHLATHPTALAELRQRLAANRLTSTLYDTPRFTRHIEAAFQRMWDIWAAGGEPEPFSVKPLPKSTVPKSTPLKQISSGSPAAPKISRFFYAGCPLCASRDVAVFTTADCTAHPSYAPCFDPQITWLSCQACSHIFTNGFFAPAEAPAAQQARLGADIETGRRTAAKIVTRIAHYRPQGHWLDVDVGDGALLFTSAEWGFTAHGLDRNEQTVALLRQLGFAADCGRLEDRNGPQVYDVISLSHGLPRAADPRAMLAAVRRLLLPGGLLFLSLPNKDALAFAFLHAHGQNPYWSELTDYHLFGRERLYDLLRSDGFEPLDYQVSESQRIGMEVIAQKLA